MYTLGDPKLAPQAAPIAQDQKGWVQSGLRSSDDNLYFMVPPTDHIMNSTGATRANRAESRI